MEIALHRIVTKGVLVGGTMDGETFPLPTIIFPMVMTSVVHHRDFISYECYHWGQEQGLYYFHERRIVDARS